MPKSSRFFFVWASNDPDKNTLSVILDKGDFHRLEVEAPYY